MSTFALEALVREAGTILASAACEDGVHDWESEGGRACPKGWCDCSQAVLRCRTCGDYDYGERGGPAHEHCFGVCRRWDAEGDDA
jgi:hypothetical protein